MKRKLPTLDSDQAAADFVDSADLSKYDLSTMKPMRFEFAAKESRVNMRLPGELLAAVKAAANKAGVPYQRYIRHALEEAIGR
jgi:predicted DNA binding CopG/RHH family protein